MVEYFKQEGCICLETEWKPARERWRFICSCGNESSCYPYDFKYKGQRCYQCKLKKLGKAKRTSREKIEEYFEDKVEELIEIVYGGDTKVRYFCKNGHENYKNFTHFKLGHGCKQCAIEKRSIIYRKDIEEVREEFRKQGCELLSDTYINMDLPLKYKCECGNVAIGYLAAIRKGIKCGCGYKTGKDSPQWRHDLSQEERELRRKYPEYKDWRKSVFERDNYTCQICYAYGTKLNAHHLMAYSTYPELRVDINNGVTLCDFCHREFHSLYGVKNFNDLDYKDYYNLTKDRRQIDKDIV